MKAEKTKQYQIIVERDEDGLFVASVPALPGCHTQAKDLATLRTRIREAIALCVELAKSDKRYRTHVRALAYEPTFIGLDTVAV